MMDKDTTYNGWTNYETWRVNLEMFDADFSSDNDMDPYDLGQSLREIALEIVGQYGSGITLDYAEAFLNSVNWYEIAAMNIDAYRPEAELDDDSEALGDGYAYRDYAGQGEG